MSIRVGQAAEAPPFQKAALPLLDDTQLRKNVRHATNVITRKRAAVVGEQHDWQQLRASASAIKEHTLRHLDRYLEQFEKNRIILDLIQQQGGKEIIKVKTMTSDEISLNPALEAAGIHPHETDLADMIIQLGRDKPSHIVVPALHKNRQQVREIFMREMGLNELGDRPEDLTTAARNYLREKFLRVKIGFSGANYLIAETGGVCVVESEGNGRMCLTLPETLITIAGIEKVIPTFRDLEVFLQLLPRSATGERMNPYNSLWTGVHKGEGPQNFHVILLDNGRTRILSDQESRQTLRCIRCGACQNACPVYRQTSGLAYGSIYAGPIGAILTPQLFDMQHAQTLPYASSLCGACYEVCPVKINIPEVLIHLRGRVVREQQSSANLEAIGMKVMSRIFSSRRTFESAQRLGRLGQWPFVSEGWVKHLPGMLGNWTEVRDLRPMPAQTFRTWWKNRQKQKLKLEDSPGTQVSQKPGLKENHHA